MSSYLDLIKQGSLKCVKCGTVKCGFLFHLAFMTNIKTHALTSSDNNFMTIIHPGAHNKIFFLLSKPFRYVFTLLTFSLALKNK